MEYLIHRGMHNTLYEQYRLFLTNKINILSVLLILSHKNRSSIMYPIPTSFNNLYYRIRFNHKRRNVLHIFKEEIHFISDSLNETFLNFHHHFAKHDFQKNKIKRGRLPQQDKIHGPYIEYLSVVLSH